MVVQNTAPENRIDPQSLHMAAGSQIASGNLIGAREIYAKLLDMYSSDVRALAGLGAIAGALGQHDIAVGYLEKACSIGPENPVVLHNYGESLRHIGKLTQAEAALRKVITIDQKFLPAYKSLIAIIQVKHAETLKLNDKDQSSKFAGEIASLTISCGNILMENGSVPDAIETYRHSLSIQPSNAVALSNLGNALRLAGQMSEAEMVCRKALALSPDFAAALNNMGNVLNEQGRFDEATECYKRALAIQPNFPEAIHNLGSGSLFNLFYSNDLSSEEIFERHKKWGAGFPAIPQRVKKRLIVPGKRLRIAYLSRISGYMQCCTSWNQYWLIMTGNRLM